MSGELLIPLDPAGGRGKLTPRDHLSLPSPPQHLHKHLMFICFFLYCLNGAGLLARMECLLLPKLTQSSVGGSLTTPVCDKATHYLLQLDPSSPPLPPDPCFYCDPGRPGSRRRKLSPTTKWRPRQQGYRVRQTRGARATLPLCWGATNRQIHNSYPS